MATLAADDFAEIQCARKALLIARCDPALLMKCAMMTRTLQSECAVCNDPQVPCIGCFRRRTGDMVAGIADCPVCWDNTARPCPAR